jgi:DNA-binding CsgD family transcriptional regulator
MTTSVGTENELLDLLYSASGDSALWTEFLAHTSRLFEAPWTGLISVDPASQRHSLEAHFGYPHEVPRMYQSYYGAMDPWYLGYKAKNVCSWAGAGEGLCPTSEVENSPFYNDFLRPFGAHHICASIIDQGEGRLAVLTILRGPGQREYSSRHVRLVKNLHPHMARALRLHRKMLDLKHAAAAAANAIDVLDAAIVGLEQDGKVCFLNVAAESLLRSNKILFIQDGKIAPCDSREAAAFENLWKSASSRDIDVVPGEAITLNKDDRSLHVSALPFTSRENLVSVRLKVFLILTDPDAPPKSRERLLTRLFRLTPAETRVAMLLTGGLEPNEIATRTRTTGHTVRSHLKSIFQKTNVTRQSQLTRLISRLPT